jgi:tetratricopeptide (TPR) repeat protein
MFRKLLPLALVLVATLPTFAQNDPFDNLEKDLLQKMPKHTVYSTIAGMLQGSGQYDKAIGYYNKLLGIYAEDPGKQSAKYAWALAKVAECYESKNDPDKAKEHCKQCMDIVNGNKFETIDELYLSDARKICADYATGSAAKPGASVPATTPGAAKPASK